MELFNRWKEAIFLKESSNAEEQLEKLRALEPFLNKEGRSIVKQDIKNLEYGITGEKNIAYELKNSHMPMYILHDIYLEYGELSAQIDYLVFTRKICFVIECKNLYGDIEINSEGDFIRIKEFGGKKSKEGMYSPIRQNENHLNLMKKIKVESRSNVLTRFMAEKYFEDFNKSIVVLANPKTVLHSRFAKKEVKSQVIRADQLVKYIRNMYDQCKESADSGEKTLAWAQSYLKLHKEVEKDYTKKYEQYKMEIDGTGNFAEKSFYSKPEDIISNEVKAATDETDLFKELKAFRLDKSRDEGIKPYYIYNDSQLKDLIAKMPGTKAELRGVSGFGEIKAAKYGDDILRIIEKYRLK